MSTNAKAWNLPTSGDGRRYSSPSRYAGGGGGTLVNGQSLTLIGSGFGSKSPAAPHFFDNFEAGAVGSALTAGTAGVIGTYADVSAPLVPRYSDAQAFSGTKSLVHDWPGGNAGCYAIISGLGNAQAVYFSYRVRKFLPASQGGATSEQWNMKYARVAPTTNFQQDGSETTAPLFPNYTELGGVLTQSPTNAQIAQSAGLGSAFKIGATYSGPTLATNAWHRMEAYCRLPSPFNTDTGERWFKLNGDCPFYQGGAQSRWADPFATAAAAIPTTEYRGAAINTFNGASVHTGFNHFITPYECNSNYVMTLWIDELYVDITQARVEIGDNPSFYSCTKRSPQPPTAWSNTSVTVTLNRGNMSPGEPAYGFVITAAGTIIALGAVGTWQ